MSRAYEKEHTLNLKKPVGYKSPMQVMIDELQIKPITQNDINILPSYLRTDQELETKLNRVLYELGKLNQEGFHIALLWCTDQIRSSNGTLYFQYLALVGLLLGYYWGYV